MQKLLRLGDRNHQSLDSRLVRKIYPEVRRERSAVFLLTFDVPFDTPSTSCRNQTAVRQCDAPVHCRQRTYGLPGEMGFGRGLLMFAHGAEVRESTRSQRTHILRLPVRLAPTLEY